MSGTTQTVNVPILEDSLVEPDEIVNIRIFGLSVGSAQAVIAAGAGTGTITIVNINSKFPEQCSPTSLRSCSNVYTLRCRIILFEFEINEKLLRGLA